MIPTATADDDAHHVNPTPSISDISRRSEIVVLQTIADRWYALNALTDCHPLGVEFNSTICSIIYYDVSLHLLVTIVLVAHDMTEPLYVSVVSQPLKRCSNSPLLFLQFRSYIYKVSPRQNFQCTDVRCRCGKKVISIYRILMITAHTSNPIYSYVSLISLNFMKFVNFMKFTISELLIIGVELFNPSPISHFSFYFIGHLYFMFHHVLHLIGSINGWMNL